MFKRLLAALAVLIASGTAVGAQEFPVTIAHAYGETTIQADPQRIVTWGWGSTDAVIALGEVPVGVPYFDYGADTEGKLRWIKDGIAKLGADYPSILPAGYEVPVEAIAALKPDLILAVYSGLTQREYDVLSGIAPVVAFPDAPWSTRWQETITLTGKAMGKSAEADELVQEITQFVAEETAKYPQLAGATFASIMEYDSQVAVYADKDSRVQFLVDAGLASSPAVAALADGEEFYYQLAFEQFDRLTADVLVYFADTPEDQAKFLANPVVALHPQISSGAVASIVGPELVTSVSPPTALSVRWGYPQYIELIADAVSAERE